MYLYGLIFIGDNMSKNYYEILGLSEDATQDEIKQKYRKLAAKYHPDRPNGNQRLFSEISVAFACLSKPSKKFIYDEELKRQKKEKESADYSYSSYQQQETKYSNQDFYNDSFNYQRPANDVKKEKPIHLYLNLSIKESTNGCKKNIQYERVILCSFCLGAGWGFLANGNNKVECPKCKGTGQKLVNENVCINIPKNMIAGMKLRLIGKGNETSLYGYETGDVFINIKWKGDWYSKNKNIYSEYSLSKNDLKNGFFYFKNFDGKKLKITIPEGISEGQYIKIEKKGWTPFNSNLYIKLSLKKGLFGKISGFFKSLISN